MSGKLFIVATPIGNLEDLTPRARQTLAEADLVAAEDTRHTGRLLSHFSIKTPTKAFHEHNEEQLVESLIEQLKSGASIALVSDAGTPLVSDPGYRLVQAAHANGIAVSPVAGASAATAALSVAGLPTDRFCFEGFLPAKRKARRDRIEALAQEPRTMILYESVHRVHDCLADLVATLGADRPAFIGRELTKLHEQCVQATLGELLQQVGDETIVGKGEFVIVIGGADEEPASSVDVDALLTGLAEHVSVRDAAKIAAKLTGASRNELYERLLALKDE